VVALQQPVVDLSTPCPACVLWRWYWLGAPASDQSQSAWKTLADDGGASEGVQGKFADTSQTNV
jgi:hypothetical protein